MSQPPRDLGRVAFATWAFLLHVRGIRAQKADVAAAIEACLAATDDASGERAGDALIVAVDALFGAPSTPEAMSQAATALYGAAAGAAFTADDREARVQAIRKYQFARGLPWLARIWERSDGQVAPTWLLIEKIDDQVYALDPDPWNDIDEERALPVADFHVLWELDGNTHLTLS